MLRDERLEHLSSEHHRTLVLARRLTELVSAGEATDALAASTLDRLERDLLPHFRAEEEVLLPPLEAAGAHTLAARIREEHRRIEQIARDAARGEPLRLGELAAELLSHVRFEERELLPAADRTLPNRVLDEVARRTRPPLAP